MARWRHCHLLAVIALTAVLGGPRDVRGEEGGPSSGGPPVVENRLAKERSPYLRQHRTNPVDWYPWSDEAFARAHGFGGTPVIVRPADGAVLEGFRPAAVLRDFLRTGPSLAPTPAPKG